MKQHRTFRARATAARMESRERAFRFALALLATGLLIGQLLLLIGP